MDQIFANRRTTLAGKSFTASLDLGASAANVNALQLFGATGVTIWVNRMGFYNAEAATVQTVSFGIYNTAYAGTSYPPVNMNDLTANGSSGALTYLQTPNPGLTYNMKKVICPAGLWVEFAPVRGLKVGPNTGVVIRPSAVNLACGFFIEWDET